MEENEELNDLLLNNASGNNDNEKIEESKRAIRASFIAKVYSIFLFQLIITYLFSYLFQKIIQNKDQRENLDTLNIDPVLFDTSYLVEILFNFFLIISFGCFIIIFFYPNLIRKYPYNFIILIIITIGISYTNTYITLSSPGSVWFLLFLKIVDVETLILYANERDFTLYSKSIKSSFPYFESGKTDPEEIEEQKQNCRNLLCHVNDCFLKKINWCYFVFKFKFHRILFLNFRCDQCNKEFVILMHKTQNGKEIITENQRSYNDYNNCYKKKWEYILKRKISYGFCEQCFDEASGDWTIIKNNCGDFAKFIWEKIKKKDS